MSSLKHSFTEQAKHATLVFEREIPSAVSEVFDAFASAKIRSEWGAPSDTAVIIYDTENFSEGGFDRYRCGSKQNPNIHGTTHYLEIIKNNRIVSTETIVMEGKRLCASLTTLELEQTGKTTRLLSTTQVASFVGDSMIKGHEDGHNSSFTNLVRYFSDRQQA
ncbi:MAG: SRPBCC domain-containing protein [Pseudomonadota bacterium]|uniref:SRPBCC domain-containing protein n=1 Tax=Polaromonas sp. TaxID=1869339 RepID=UPI0017995019|nr:SRPBCC domain-containing protein [Polaromonas sp.]MBA3594863.1 SRPBCC domain-containing protein [Polaromonas sp.]MDQ3271561.1 SRPBCC domain-containing protein [Pseudomonadota bacterium]